MRVNSGSPLRVLHLTQKLGTGGLERTLVELCEQLQSSTPVQPTVYVYDDVYERPLVRELERRRIPFVLQTKPPGFSWHVVFEILRICRENDIKVIHTHDLNALLYGALAKLLSGWRLRVVHTQHTFLHLKSRKQALYERIFPRFADLLVCPAGALIQTYLKLGYPMRKLRTVTNPVALAAPVPNERNRASALMAWGPEPRARLQSLSEDRWILVLGRVHPGKGQEELLTVWPQLDAALRRQLRVLFVGPSSDSDYRARLEACSRALPDGERLMWFPSVTDPRPCFAAADVFLSLSVFEGLPLAPIEAYGAGLPVVLSDIPGHRDLGLPGTEWVPLTSPVETVAAVSRALVSAKPPTPTERAEIRRRNDPAAVAQAYAELYREVLGEEVLGETPP